MNPEAVKSLALLRQKLRKASIATLGGFRPPADPRVSYFGAGVALPAEGLPVWNGKAMFPLLQIRVAELPFIPEQLQDIALLVLFHNDDEHPFDQPHGEGWLIREYREADLEHLQPLPPSHARYAPKPFPIAWQLVEDDAPGWEDGWNVLDLDAINHDEAATDAFFDDFSRYANTKVGGYPKEIQHGAGIHDFVFQVGSEEKSRWMWGDNGIGYFFKDADGVWSWGCQFY
ncbi:DUF1963 domain-containing protein [Undibacterium sp. Di27W]|uniref:DUF1963 domain-containing protein n=1 Tax=Undibacterium sp. Di27W TaxID=3413036 RepID=UPI003BF146B2